MKEIVEPSTEQYCRIIDLWDSCMDDYLYIYDIAGDYYYISPSATERFALESNAFHDVPENHKKFVYPEDVEMLSADLELLITGQKDTHDLEYRWLSTTGSPIWINCRGKVLKDHHNRPQYLIGCINEIGIRQKADNVSGLLGETSLRTFIDGQDGSGRKGFLLRVGIDNFKDINENKGMEYGDQVLLKTAGCIQDVISASQKLYRVVADEFIIMDVEGQTALDAAQLYGRIQQQIEKLIEQNRYEVLYTLSGGILDLSDISDQSYCNLMKLSEFSLNQAKRNGKNRCYLFDDEDYEQSLRKKKLAQVMRKAVESDYEGFEAYYQPIMDANRHELEGAETLMRFHTPEYGMVSPAEFIPILEETGLIIPLGKWILNEAMAFCKEVHKYLPNFKVNVNLSYIQVMKSNIFEEIVEGMKKYELKPSDIVIELTESGFLESDDHFKEFCKGLRENHIQLALDDFGTGYSNFHYLYDLKPNIIKIDRSFTLKALENEYEYNLLNHMVDLTHNIKLKMCIEGIETMEDLNVITNLNPDFIQGYYFGKPCPAQELLDKYVRKDK